MILEKHIQNVVRRSKSFFAKQRPGHLLINVSFPVAAPEIPPLYQFNLDKQLNQWLDANLAARRPLWQAKQGLDDDWIPAICPRFGIAEHSAWLGMDVVLQEDTCLSLPLLQSPADMDRIQFSEQNKWFLYMKKGYDYLRSKKDGCFVLAHRGTMTPMDLANAARGDEIFVDFALSPEFCHHLMKFLLRAASRYYQYLCSWADHIAGGFIFFIGNNYLEQSCLGHLSNDLAMLCSPEVYRQFGFPYEQQWCQKYQRVFYHVHNEKMHFVPELVKLPNLALLEVSNDPKTPATLDDLARIFFLTGKANLMLHGSSDQVRKHWQELQQRNVWLQVDCEDRIDAADVIAFVRDRSLPL